VIQKREQIASVTSKPSETFLERIMDAEHALAGIKVIHEATMDPRNLMKLIDTPTNQLYDEITKNQPIPKIAVSVHNILKYNFEEQLKIRVPTFQSNRSTNIAIYVKFIKILLHGNVSKSSGKAVQSKMDQFVNQAGSSKSSNEIQKITKAKEKGKATRIPTHKAETPAKRKRSRVPSDETGLRTPTIKRKPNERGFTTPVTKEKDQALPFTPLGAAIPEEDESQMVPNGIGRDKIAKISMKITKKVLSILLIIIKIILNNIVMYIYCLCLIMKRLTKNNTKLVYPNKRTKCCSIIARSMNKRAKNKNFNLHNMKKSVITMPNSENNCPSNCYCNSQENVNENNTKFEQDSLDEIKEIDFKFDSPGGKRKENKVMGKMK